MSFTKPTTARVTADKDEKWAPLVRRGLSLQVTMKDQPLQAVSIKVIPDLIPAAIQINGVALKEFKPEVKAYSFLLKDKSEIPVVSAKAVSKTTDVEIVQATGLPGTAIVKFVDKNTVEENLYYLNFDRVSVSDF